MKLSTSIIAEFLNKATEKIINLFPEGFERITQDYDFDRYIFRKWEEKEKCFSSVYLNLDHNNREAFMKYIGITEDTYYHAEILAKFLMFCCNYDTSEYENPFTGHYAKFMTKKATGKKKSQGIPAQKIIQLYHKLDKPGRWYLVNCCFFSTKLKDKFIKENSMTV